MAPPAAGPSTDRADRRGRTAWPTTQRSARGPPRPRSLRSGPQEDLLRDVPVHLIETVASEAAVLVRANGRDVAYRRDDSGGSDAAVSKFVHRRGNEERSKPLALHSRIDRHCHDLGRGRIFMVT